MLAQQMQLSLQRPAAVCRSMKRQRTVRCSATQTVETEVKETTQAGGKVAEIYIGHSKDDIEAKKAGQKGRFVVDNPDKYPKRNEFVGGWAGGEKGLKDFVAAYQREKELNAAPAAKKDGPVREPKPIAQGSDVIYIGKGRTITDDARKYPSRNELTGGFAGGELGLTVFKEKGDVPISADGRGTKQSSPLITAFVLGLAATGGGLLLNTVQEVGINVAQTGSPAAADATSLLGLDESTKTLLTAGVLLVGVIGTVSGAQLLIDSMATKIREGASKLAVLGAFWTAVFLAAKLVLDS